MGIQKRISGSYGKLDTLSAAARFDVCLSSCSGNSIGGSGRFRDPDSPFGRWLYPATVPGKGEVHILKVLQTNICKNTCVYCSLSCRSDSERRMTFSPDELARIYMDFVYRRLVHGIFISSGIAGNSESSMERMIATAEILRNRYSYSGYIHLKVLPGISSESIAAAARYADRLSTNLEAPTRNHLRRIAPGKDFIRDLIVPMRKTASILKSGVRSRSQTTQFVVGCSDESDLDILKTTDWLYRDASVFRAYFSAYQNMDSGKDAGIPAVSGPSNHTDSPLLREHRLYQADFLLRGYGFTFSDLVFDESGRIPPAVDPKTAHAMMHPELFPVDVNTAEPELLLRVPGIGPVSTRHILERRTRERWTNLEELKSAGVRTGLAEQYLEFRGGTSDREIRWKQNALFEKEPPETWKTGCTPAGLERTEPNPLAGKAQARYPGQEGKLLMYHGRGSREKVYCR